VVGYINVHDRDRHLTTSYNRAVGLKILLCAMALGTFLASSACPQVLDGTILLPDSLGPLTGKTYVAFDENPSHPRMFIGSEGGDVLVVDAITGQRIARIPTGPVSSICYSPKHNRLYTSARYGYAVAVADCGSYQVTKVLQFSDYVNRLFYNQVVDRVYCGAHRLKVVDCSTDSIVDSLGIDGLKACFAFDSTRNVLYIGAADTFRVLDCSRDSVVASIPELRAPQAVCFQPSASKVYVAAGESLFALSAKTYSVVYRHGYDTLDAQLAVDPVRNRVYYTYRSNLIALDCATDSIMWNQDQWARAIGLACAPAHDKLYRVDYGSGLSGVSVYDGSTGQILSAWTWGPECESYHCAAVNRVFLVAHDQEASWIDCDADSICGGIPLRIGAYNMCVDAVHNRLYFCNSGGGAGGYIGVVDCAANKVTSYLTAFNRPSWLTYEPVSNKLYACGYDSSIFVYDCAAETLLRTIHTDNRTYSMYWHPTLHKIYAVVLGPKPGGGGAHLWVIDPVSDTVTKSVPLLGKPDVSFLVPEYNQFWFFYGCYTVVDCLRDSIVMEDTMPPWSGSHADACCSPLDRRVYAVPYGYEGDSVMYVIDMDSESIIGSIPVATNSYSRQVFCATRARKVYWLFQNQGVAPDSVFAIGTSEDSVVASFTMPSLSTQVFSDRTGDYVYFMSDSLNVLDTRNDSVVNRVGLPLYPDNIVKNNATNRLYLAGSSETIQVVYDSVVLSGVHSAPAGPIQNARQQTLLNRSQPLRCAAPGILFDPSGRRIAVLKPGMNDIGRLAPGIYFVRSKPSAVSRRL
jgi:DNA-binding beta-propeller fold protein YncE